MKKVILMAITISTLTSNTHALTQNQFDTTLYGIIKTSALYSSDALASFNNINLSAPTHTAPRTRYLDSKDRLSFQAQQSRVGLLLKKGDNLDGKLEFDFVDFNKSSPTTQMNPRVRIAAITYRIDDKNRINLGQDWDLFSPVGAYTYDFIGLYFMAGNTGFMRQQIQFFHQCNKFELGAAIGMAGNNPGVSDSDLEIASRPSYSARTSYVIDKQSRIGLSAIYAGLKYATTTNSTSDSYGFNSFYEQVFSVFQIKSEMYYGQNLANIGALALGKGTASSDIREYGAFASLSTNVVEGHGIIAGLGFAHVENKNTLPAFVLGTTGAITTAGIAQNNIARTAYERKFTSDFSWITEYTHFNTTAKLAQGQFQTSNANSIETGMILKF